MSLAGDHGGHGAAGESSVGGCRRRGGGRKGEDNGGVGWCRDAPGGGDQGPQGSVSDRGFRQERTRHGLDDVLELDEDAVGFDLVVALEVEDLPRRHVDVVLRRCRCN